MPIQVLPSDVANQIAAGEVVERPASVVKELIENSLDAGATEIRVEVREGGRRLIRVQDNGCGIRAGETALLFQRHATSKIRRAEDLERLTTLGFRGEALASIGSVAQVTLLTRSADEEIGSLLRFSGGGELKSEPRGGPPGTVVTVEHLFANVPARLKFLKQAATEAGHILQIVTRHAMAYPDRRFSLTSEGRLTFQSTGSGKLYDVLVKIFGLDMSKQLLSLEPPGSESAEIPDGYAADAATRVKGYIGVPALHRSNRNHITLFVNRRWFQDSSVAYAVIQAYHTLLPTGRYPVGIIFIEMDPAEVDVNVHPTKAEVRFRDSYAVFRAVQHAARTVLTEHAPIPEVGLGFAASIPRSTLTWQQMEGWGERRDALLGPQGGGSAGIFPAHDPGSTPTPDALWGQARPEHRGPAIDVPLAPDLRPQKIPLLRVVGQLGAMYVVAEGPDGLYLIDQHAAHERILYEQMMASIPEQKVVSQTLLEPVVLELSPEQAAVVAEELERLRRVGVAIEPFGGDTYLVRSIPAIMSRDQPQTALAEIIDGLSDHKDTSVESRENQLVTMICKRSAIKAGQVLSLHEMQTMVHQLEACHAPRTCPHGRPTMIHVSGAELARQFGRI